MDYSCLTFITQGDVNFVMVDSCDWMGKKDLFLGFALRPINHDNSIWPSTIEKIM